MKNFTKVWNLCMIFKITRAEIGLGGRYNSEYGLSIFFDRQGTPTKIFVGTRLFSEIEPHLDEAMDIIRDSVNVVKLLELAEVTYVSELVGKPIMCTFSDSGEVTSWSIVTTF